MAAKQLSTEVPEAGFKVENCDMPQAPEHPAVPFADRKKVWVKFCADVTGDYVAPMQKWVGLHALKRGLHGVAASEDNSRCIVYVEAPADEIAMVEKEVERLLAKVK